MIQALYYKIIRIGYLLRKLPVCFSKDLVVYTKNHPIYTSIFEDEQLNRYGFVYIDINKKWSWIERLFISKSKLLHIDAASYKIHKFDKPKLFTKPAILECEGLPRDEYLTDERLNKILIEGIAAGKVFYKKYDKVELCYPSMK